MALGSDAAQMTAVFAQAPGPLQLLPSPEYGMNWLKIKDGEQLASLPKSDPYSEIYVKRGAWWSLCDDKLINPLDQNKKSLEQDWAAYETIVKKDVLFFHDALAGPDRNGRYHGNTYAFYGDDPAHSTWGDVVWKRRTAPYYESRGGMPKMDDPLGGSVISGDGKGYVGLKSNSGGRPDLALFDLQPAADNGDGTVPVRSGGAPGPRVKACVPFPSVDHEGAYKEHAQQLFALWAVTKIAYTVRYTDMAYKT